MRRPGLIILAAGGSTRMGEPKQLLPWGESTLLRHACVTALQSGCHPVILVLGCEAERCRRACEGLPLTSIVNANWAQGLGSSVAAGIAALLKADFATAGALVMLADQPAVTPALLKSLVAAWAPPRRSISAVQYGSDAGVPAVFDQSHFPELLGLRHDRGARELIARERTRVAVIDAGAGLIDVDTPAAYREHRSGSPDRAEVLLGDFTD